MDALKSELNIIREELENLEQQATTHKASHTLTREQVGDRIVLLYYLLFIDWLIVIVHIALQKQDWLYFYDERYFYKKLSYR